MINFLLLPRLLAIKDRVQTDLATGLSVKNIVRTITDPDIIGALEGVAEQMFPLVAPELRLAATIASSYDTNGVKWVQNALNKLVEPSPNLDVDGETGPLTIAAVKQLQIQAGNIIGIDLKPDGWAGDKTMAAIQYLLSKLDADELITPVTQPEALPAPTV